MMNRSWATINLSKLRHNLQRVKALAPGRSILAMVKSNGYGHGLLTVAKALPTADGFGVACLSEALALRAAGIQQAILLMMGVYSAADLHQVATHDISIVVHHPEQVSLLEQSIILPRPVTVWLKMETGMHRLGISRQQIADIYQRLQACPNIKKPLHLITHLAEADHPEKITTTEQLNCFNAITANWPESKSIANSAGILAWPVAHADWVRPGIMLYGISPFANQTSWDFDLQPAMTLQSRLIAVNTCQPGDAVGYGSTWVCSEETKIGIVAIGYGDGYPLHVPSGTPTVVRGIRCPLVGRVSMDMLAIDLRNCPSAQIGDTVILWGPELPIEEVARSAGTIAYELLCQITSRVEVEVIDDTQAEVE